eukprot:3931494-Alexandrium_andersonii.AAC.1
MREAGHRPSGPGPSRRAAFSWRAEHSLQLQAKCSALVCLLARGARPVSFWTGGDARHLGSV